MTENPAKQMSLLVTENPAEQIKIFSKQKAQT